MIKMEGKVSVSRKCALTVLILAIFAFGSVGEAQAAQKKQSASKKQAPKVGFVVKDGQWQRQSGGKDAGDPIEPAPQQEDGMEIYGDFFLNDQEREILNEDAEGYEIVVNITELYVKSVKDWKDYPDKAKARNLTVTIPAAQKESDELNMDAFSLKDGHVFKDGEKLDCEVYEIPEGIDNEIKNWAAIGTETSDSVTEAETGVWFFGNEGQLMTFIPLDNEHEYQDLLWSPSGDRLILVRGSGMRPDVFFELYDEGMEKKAEFSGLRGEIAWLEDGMRFAFTRIDDVRDSEDGVYSSSLLKLSAVLYDSTVDETVVLKESTDTKNYRFSEISDDGEKIVITEESVKSPKDWGDEEKVKEREIKVPVPAAG
jgi:hypothetical protein